MLGAPAAGFIGAPHLAKFEEFDAPAAATGVLAAGTWLVNARCAPAIDARVPVGASVVRVGGRVAARRLQAPQEVAAVASDQASLLRDKIDALAAPPTLLRVDSAPAGATVWGYCPDGHGRAFAGLPVARVFSHMDELRGVFAAPLAG